MIHIWPRTRKVLSWTTLTVLRINQIDTEDKYKNSLSGRPCVKVILLSGVIKMSDRGRGVFESRGRDK